MRRVVVLSFVLLVSLVLTGGLLGQGPAGEPAQVREARAAAEAYLGAFLEIDADGLERLFHDDWRMSALMPGGDYRSITRHEYLERVRAAAERPDATEYTGRVTHVSVKGRAAVALLELESDEVAFHEFISMLRTAEGWKVVQKTVDVSPK